jgi:molybdopterin converting factor small subunit
VAVVRLRNPLKEKAGGAEHELEGATVLDLLRALEDRSPGVKGWILDERGKVRRHINVFVDGELGSGDTPTPAGARVDVLPAISGG